MDNINTQVLNFNIFVDVNMMQIWVMKQLCENNEQKGLYYDKIINQCQ